LEGFFNDLNDHVNLNSSGATCIDSYTVDRSQVPGLTLQLAVNCPPTFDMIFEKTEAKLLEGVKLETKIDEQISERVNPLTWSLQQTDERLEEIYLRVAQLEEELKNLKMLLSKN
jgi:hypothetical protein